MIKITHRVHLSVPFMLGLAIMTSCLSTLATAAEEDVSQNDPPRWYQPDDTPQKHYQNLLKEANAAYAQSLQECKALKGIDAKACRHEARQNYAADKARAQRILKLLKNQQG